MERGPKVHQTAHRMGVGAEHQTARLRVGRRQRGCLTAGGEHQTAVHPTGEGSQRGGRWAEPGGAR